MEITSSIEIERPASEVFAFVADMSNNTRWQGGQQRCDWTSEPPIGVGSTYDQEAKFLGRAIVSSFEVTEFEADRLIRIVSTAGTMPIDVTRTVEQLGQRRCRVTARVKGDPPGLMRLAGPLMKRLVGRNVDRDYDRLKALLESSPA